MGEIARQIRDILEKEFSPSVLEVTNDSEKHRGHAGYDGSGESHFTVTIKSGAFEGLSRVACHRMIYGALDLLLKQKIHALALNVIKS